MTVRLAGSRPHVHRAAAHRRQPSERTCRRLVDSASDQGSTSSARPVLSDTVDASGASGRAGFAEYHAPPRDSLPLSIQPLTAPSYLAGHDAELRRASSMRRRPTRRRYSFARPSADSTARSRCAPPAVTSTRQPWRQQRSRRARTNLSLPCFAVGRQRPFPPGVHGKPWDWDYDGRASWPLEVVSPRTPLRLFSPRFRRRAAGVHAHRRRGATRTLSRTVLRCHGTSGLPLRATGGRARLES